MLRVTEASQTQLQRRSSTVTAGQRPEDALAHPTDKHDPLTSLRPCRAPRGQRAVTGLLPRGLSRLLQQSSRLVHVHSSLSTLPAGAGRWASDAGPAQHRCHGPGGRSRQRGRAAGRHVNLPGTVQLLLSVRHTASPTVRVSGLWHALRLQPQAVRVAAIPSPSPSNGCTPGPPPLSPPAPRTPPFSDWSSHPATRKYRVLRHLGQVGCPAMCHGHACVCELV